MIKINAERCIGCGKCAEDCLALNIEVGKTASVRGACIQCGHCVAVCPTGAVAIPEYDMDDVEEYHEEDFCPDPEQVLRSIKFRRSIRSYKEQKVSKHVLELLVQAGRYTATAKNSQSNGFIFVQQELEVLKELVWNYIDEIEKNGVQKTDRELLPYIAFNHRRKADPKDDFLFRNAPVVLFITSDYVLDAGLAAQNMETMAVSMGMGVLYNGYLARIAEANEELKRWLGIENKTIRACMLAGYPDRSYVRTAPRKPADVIWK